ncbi:MAG: hypothetical protein RL497_392 [Pseudomonadota bacterium]|jgi:putative transposase
MNTEKLKTLAQEPAKGIKTPADLNSFSSQLTKLVIEAALNAELTEHLGYPAHAIEGRNGAIAATAAHRKSSKATGAKSPSTPPATATAASNPSLLKKAKRGLPPWTNKFSASMPEA